VKVFRSSHLAWRRCCSWKWRRWIVVCHGHWRCFSAWISKHLQ